GGEFLEIDEGNRLRRAVVGFGAGQADVHVQVEVFDLLRDPRTPVLVYGTAEASSKAPGGAVMTAATHNPYAMAARYVLSRRATGEEVERRVKRTAAARVKFPGPRAPPPARWAVASRRQSTHIFARRGTLGCALLAANDHDCRPAACWHRFI